MRLGRGSTTFTIGLMALALVGSGCGGSGSKTQAATSSTTESSTTTPTSTSTSTTSSATTAATKPLTFAVSSPALKGHALPARYTCGGTNASLPLKWSNVPPGTKELAVFIAHNEPGHGSETDWSIVGLKPTLTGLKAGSVPPGAVLGRNGNGKTGYSVCPAKHTNGQYGLGVFALSQRLTVHSGYNGVVLLNKVNKKSPLALLVFEYKRP